MKKLFTLFIISFMLVAFSFVNAQDNKAQNKIIPLETNLIKTKIPLSVREQPIFNHNTKSIDASFMYAFASTSATYSPITGGTTLGSGIIDDNLYTALPIGFTFTYNGTAYTTFSVSANGYIVLGSSISTSFIPISSLANAISAVGRDLQGNTTGELRYQLLGSPGSYSLVIQWSHFCKYYYNSTGSGDDFNFQIKLNQTGNTIQLVYGTMTSNSTNANPQVGISGPSVYDFSNRTNTSGWASSIAGTVNTATCSLASGIIPASGLTYTWTPSSYVTSFIANITPNSTAIQTSNYLAGTIPYWSFNAIAGVIYGFSLCSNSEDSYLRIYNTSNTIVNYTDDNGPYCSGLPASITFTCPTTGTYYIVASHFPYSNFTNAGSLSYCIASPIVTTATATSITNTSATSGGNVTFDGGLTVTARGVCWSTTANPTTANSFTSDGSGTGAYISNITGLTSGTLYHYRAYATNSTGTTYGSDLTFTTTGTEAIVPYTGNNSYTVSSGSIYDHGGSAGNYNNNANGYSVIYPIVSSNKIQITGSYVTEQNFDFLYIYNGIGTGGTLLFSGSGSGTLPPLTSTDASGALTIKFTSDVSVVYSGFNISITTAVTALWTGDISTDWNTAGNWDNNTVPANTVNVNIPSSPSGGRWPHVTGGYSLGNLSLQSGANLYIDAGAYYLWVYGNIVNSGTIYSSGIYLDDISIRGGGNRTISGGTFNGVGFGIYDGTTVTANSNLNTLDALYPSTMTTFNANGYNITVSGIVYNDGIINASSGTISIGGDYTHYSSAGTFNANTSTVVFNGSNLSYIYDSPTFYKLTINNSAGVNLSGTALITNYLTLTSGVFTNGTLLNKNNISEARQNYSSIENKKEINSNVKTTVSIEETKSKGITNFSSKDILKNTDNPKYSPEANNLTFGNGATIERINGSLSTIAPTFGTRVNIIYSGSSAITTGVEIPVTTTVLNNLTINNTGGVTLGSDATVNGTLTLTNGLFQTGTFTLNFGNSAPNPSENLSSRIVGTAVMNYRNVGSGSIYFLNCNIASGSNDLGTVKITRKTGTIGAITYNGNTGIKSHWIILSTNQPTAGRSVTFEWLPVNDPVPPFATGILANIFYSTDNGTTWALTGNDVDPTTYGDLRGVTVNTTHFSMWTVSRKDKPLPVQLSSFTSSMKGRDVNLTWMTEKEINNAGFDVERKVIENNEWKKVGFVTGKGSSNSPVNYTFEDKKLNSGKYNYRLKQIDYNGNFEYHNLTSIVDVSLPTKFNLSQNYPNPFNPTTKIDFDLPEDGKTDLRIYDILGKEVATLVNEFKTAGYYTINFDASKLSSGIYFYRLNVNGFSEVKKMSLIK